MHCRAAVFEGPAANILASRSSNERVVVVRDFNWRLKVVGSTCERAIACELQKSLDFESPDVERVSFRTQTYAHARTSSTLLPSSNLPTLLVRVYVVHHTRKDVASHMLRAPLALLPSAAALFTCFVIVLASPLWHVQVSRTFIHSKTSTCA